MPSYKLIYFDGRGRAEVARLLMAYGKVKYEDQRIKGEDWPALKPKTPFGALPVLEVDNEPFCQSLAIFQFLGKTVGLGGKTDLEDMKMAMIAGCIEDTFTAMTKGFFEKDEAKKAELMKSFDESTEDWINKFQGFMDSEYFCGDKMKWIDVMMAEFIDAIPLFCPKLSLAKATKLNALKDKVLAHPEIKAHIAKRPKTPF